jgi:hypothetical protein
MTEIGQVQKYIVLRGFGFILQDFRTRLFFHINDWKGQIGPEVGMYVHYDVEPPEDPNNKRLLAHAVNIMPIGTPEGATPKTGGGQ